MSSTRVYLVTDHANGEKRLIRSTYRATAIRHAAGSRFEAHKATHDELERLITSGVRVELAGEAVTDAQAELIEPQYPLLP